MKFLKKAKYPLLSLTSLTAVIACGLFNSVTSSAIIGVTTIVGGGFSLVIDACRSRDGQDMTDRLGELEERVENLESRLSKDSANKQVG